MIHYMKLKEEPFNYIKSGEKTIEMRLFDEKRQLVKVNDSIEFENIVTKEKIVTKVVELFRFENFEELYENFDKRELGYLENQPCSPKDMSKYYAESEIEKYGVLGIRIKII